MLKRLAEKAEECPAMESLLGIEGTAARVYFARLLAGCSSGPTSDGAGFDFEGRNRRPPRDPVNALLSFAYSLLTKELTVALRRSGFDPLLGFYHQPRFGRPALALDLMEEFRPPRRRLGRAQRAQQRRRRPTTSWDAADAVSLQTRARRVLIAYERRMDQLVTHPVFGYRISYRRVLEVQARLLGRHLPGRDSTPTPRSGPLTRRSDADAPDLHRELRRLPPAAPPPRLQDDARLRRPPAALRLSLRAHRPRARRAPHQAVPRSSSTTRTRSCSWTSAPPTVAAACSSALWAARIRTRNVTPS